MNLTEFKTYRLQDILGGNQSQARGTGRREKHGIHTLIQSCRYVDIRNQVQSFPGLELLAEPSRSGVKSTEHRSQFRVP